MQLGVLVISNSKNVGHIHIQILAVVSPTLEPMTWDSRCVADYTVHEI